MPRLRFSYLFPGDWIEILGGKSWLGKLGIAAVIFNLLFAIDNCSNELHDIINQKQFKTGHLGYLAWLLVSAWLAQWRAKSLMRGSLYVNPSPRNSCAAIVFFLSPSRCADRHKTLAENLPPADVIAGYDKDPWQQCLRAVNRHLTEWSADTLERIVVIMSCGAKGSCSQFSDFQQTIHRLAPTRKLVIESAPDASEGIDFEDATALSKCLAEVYAYLERKGIPDRGVIVDITGGQKPCSAVGCAASLEENRRFQYVSTITGEVRVYDLDFLAKTPGTQ
ncbi:MAG: hypothetical protein FJW39_11760 [Acidobacteria bacterium]|nr:hypothetical protein [Acidobacteriota bacterium]